MVENMDWRMSPSQQQEGGPRTGKTGRFPISQPLQKTGGRMHFSMRALKGKISIINVRCPHCFHHKAIRNDSPDSPFYDHVKCARCKKDIEV